MVRASLMSLLLAFALAAPAEARPGGAADAPERGGASAAVGDAATGGEVAEAPEGEAFSELERRLIREFFGKGGKERDGDEDDDKGSKKGKTDKKAKKDKDAKADRKGHRGDGEGGKSKDMPPGLDKRDELPPGLQKQIERYGTLPPGLAKRDLPADLEARLPNRKAGLLREIVGEDVVLIDETTGVVLDILEGVLTK